MLWNAGEERRMWSPSLCRWRMYRTNSIRIKGVQIPYRRDCLRHLQHGLDQICCPIHRIKKNIASYIQRSVGKKAYLVAQTIRTGVLQTIDLSLPVPANNPDSDDLIIVKEEVVRVVTKRRITLNQDLKKGFATLYDQFSQEMRDKLESSDGLETVQTN